MLSNQFSLKLRAGPSGLHLFDRQTGWNVLMDEVRIPSAQWALAPRQISVALTNACDLACSYCYAPKEPGKLDPTRVLNWLCELDENGCLGVGFGGGEPALHRNFTEICQQTANRTKLAVTFTTHAHRITPGYRDLLKGCVHFIRVSVDGIGLTYEALRGRLFSALTERLETIRKIAPFGINYVVNVRTFGELDAAIDFAQGWGASEFLLLPEQPVAGSDGVDAETMCALRTWVRGYRGAIPLAISEAYSGGLCTGTFSCEPGLRGYAHIDANGILKRSSYDKQGILIGKSGVMEALRRLEDLPTEGQS
jgi:MoaA/NifB/PqqE/SkfB family radical SAM enzyme